MGRACDRLRCCWRVQARQYAFKCHRKPIEGVDAPFPINTINFHPRFGTFATGGADGVVNVWDGERKKRVCQFRGYPTSVSALAFSPGSGDMLAIAASYTYEQGEAEQPADAIFVRRILDVDVKPKVRQG